MQILSLACLEKHATLLAASVTCWLIISSNDVFAICHKFDPSIWGQGRTTHLMSAANMLTEHGTFHQNMSTHLTLASF